MIASGKLAQVDRHFLEAGRLGPAAVTVAGDLGDEVVAVRALQHPVEREQRLAELVGLVVGRLGQVVLEGDDHLARLVQGELAAEAARHAEDVVVVHVAEGDLQAAVDEAARIDQRAVGVVRLAGAAEGVVGEDESIQAGIEVGLEDRLFGRRRRAGQEQVVEQHLGLFVSQRLLVVEAAQGQGVVAGRQHAEIELDLLEAGRQRPTAVAVPGDLRDEVVAVQALQHAVEGDQHLAELIGLVLRRLGQVEAEAEGDPRRFGQVEGLLETAGHAEDIGIVHVAQQHLQGAAGKAADGNLLTRGIVRLAGAVEGVVLEDEAVGTGIEVGVDDRRRRAVGAEDDVVVRGRAVEDGRVDVGAAIDDVVAGIAGQEVLAVVAGEGLIVAGRTEKDVAVLAADEDVTDVGAARCFAPQGEAGGIALAAVVEGVVADFRVGAPGAQAEGVGVGREGVAGDGGTVGIDRDRDIAEDFPVDGRAGRLTFEEVVGHDDVALGRRVADEEQGPGEVRRPLHRADRLARKEGLAREGVVRDGQAVDGGAPLGQQSGFAVGSDLVVDDVDVGLVAVDVDSRGLDPRGKRVVEADDGEALAGGADLHIVGAVEDVDRAGLCPAGRGRSPDGRLQAAPAREQVDRDADLDVLVVDARRHQDGEAIERRVDAFLNGVEAALEHAAAVEHQHRPDRQGAIDEREGFDVLDGIRAVTIGHAVGDL